MKWVSHKMVSGSLLFAITGDPFISFITALGSVVPDAIEGFPDETNYDAWRKNHRQVSHWFLPYLVTFFLSYAYAAYHGYLKLTLGNFAHLIHSTQLIPIMLSLYFAFFMLGALLHIVEDAICGYVPGILLSEKVGIKLFYVGTLQEYMLSIPLSGFLIWFRLYFLKLF